MQKTECPLGYTCELMCDQFIDDGGDLKCQNDEACEHFSLSWNLPYEYNEDGVFIVTNDPAQFHWKKELTDKKLDPQCYYCPIKGMEAGFYYRAVNVDEEEKIDYRQLIRAEWKKAGWEMASPIRETEAGKNHRKLLAEIARLIEML